MIVRFSLVFFVFLIFSGIIKCDDNVFVINGKRALHRVSDKFLSISIDPIVLTGGLNLSERSLLLAKHLSPAYIRIAGPSTNYVQFSATTNSQNDQTITITPSMWFGLNQWLSSANLTPIFAINDQGTTTNGTWNPKSNLQLLELTDKLNVTCLWQLGYDCSRKTDVQYKHDAVVFRQVLDAAFPTSEWKLVGSDFSRCLPKDIARKALAEVHGVLDAIMWEPPSTNELTFPERDMSSRFLFFTYSNSVPIWTSAPKNGAPVSFSSAILWMKQISEAAKMGYDVVFKQPRIREIFAETPTFWASFLHKILMGRKVLDIKSTGVATPNSFIYAHCTKNQNNYVRTGGMTVLIVNNSTRSFNAQLKLGLTFSKSIEVQTYILTAATKNEDKEGVLLNGDKLTLESLEKLPFKPKLRRAKVSKSLSLTVPGKSIGFFVVPAAQMQVCMDEEDEIDTILKEINADQNLPISSEISLDFSSRSLIGAKEKNDAVSTLKELRQEMDEEIKSDHVNLKEPIIEQSTKTTVLSPKNYISRKILNAKPIRSIKATDLELSSIEIKKLLIDRAIAKAAAKRIRFTSEEINELLANKPSTNKLNLKNNFLTRRLGNLEPSSTKPPVDLDLTRAEVKKVLENRARSRGAISNIKFTNQELEELTNKASEQLLKRADRKKRSPQVSQIHRTRPHLNGSPHQHSREPLRQLHLSPQSNRAPHQHSHEPSRQFHSNLQGNRAPLSRPFQPTRTSPQHSQTHQQQHHPVPNNHGAIRQPLHGNNRANPRGLVVQPLHPPPRGIIVQPGYNSRPQLFMRKKRDLVKPDLKLFHQNSDVPEPYVIPLKRDINMDLLKLKTGNNGLTAAVSKKKEYKSKFANREEKAATLRDPNQTSSQLLQSSEEEQEDEDDMAKANNKPKLPQGEIFAELAEPSEETEYESSEEIKPKKGKISTNFFNLHKPTTSKPFQFGHFEEKAFKSKPSSSSSTKTRKKSKNHSVPAESSERLRFLSANDGFDSVLEDDYDFPYIHEYLQKPKQNARIQETPKYGGFWEIGEFRQDRRKSGTDLRSRFLSQSNEDDFDDLGMPEADYGDLDFDMRPIRFRRDIDMNSITKEDVKTYRKLMYENLKFMQKQALKNEKRLYDAERTTKKTKNGNHHFLSKLKRHSSEENSGHIVGFGRNFMSTEENSKHLEFLKSRLLNKKKYNDKLKMRQKKDGHKEKQLKKLLESRLRNKSSVQIESDVSSTSTEHTISKRFVQIKESQTKNNNLYKMYEPLIIPKEWKPSDIFKLNKNITRLKNDINLLPRNSNLNLNTIQRNKRSYNFGNNEITKDEPFMDAFAKTSEIDDNKIEINTDRFRDISAYKKVANNLVSNENIEKVPKNHTHRFNIFEKIISKIIKIIPLEEIPLLKHFAKTKRSKRSTIIDSNVSSSENEIDSDFVNVIGKQPELNLERGDYKLILPLNNSQIGNNTNQNSATTEHHAKTTEAAIINFDMKKNDRGSRSYGEIFSNSYYDAWEEIGSWFKKMGRGIADFVNFHFS